MNQANSVDDVLATYLDLEQLGQAPTPQELLATYPDLAAELKSFLADRERFRQTARAIPPVPFARLDPARLAEPQMPRSVGSYEVVGELGRGGMGVVYKALQPKLKRLAALKMVLHASHASSQELARFRSEAQAVARLQHPNIVHVYEVGEHEGRPFFSLEFVDGGSLAERIKGKPQPTRQAAALVETLAQAIDYAHKQGIVHRDLKPANVLLTAQGMPKITDFGLAKRLEQEDGQTKTGAILGTPSYIAPEQAAGKKDVGTGADIYALGAILYELLTGRPPFRAETPMETMLQVMTSEVVPPSRIQAKVPRDLETICLKCLHKEPRKRYASALNLATDLRRFLQGESIQARPISAAERTWRWCRRRPLVAALLVAVVFTGLSGVAGITYMWRRADANWKSVEKQKAQAIWLGQQAEEQRREAEKQRQRAEENLRQARAVVEKFFTTVSESRLLKVAGLQPLRKLLLEEALRYYQSFLEKQDSKEPVVKHDLAQTYFLVGRITNDIGSKAAALVATQNSRKLYEELLRSNPADANLAQELTKEFALVLILAGRLENNLGRHDDSRRSYQRAREILMKALARGPKSTETAKIQHGLVIIYSDLGHLHRFAGRYDEAIRAFDQQRRLLEVPSPNKQQRFALIRCYLDLADTYKVVGRTTEGRGIIEKAVALAEELNRTHNDYDCQSLLVNAYHVQGHFIVDGENPVAALTLFQKARDIMDRLVQQNPGMTAFQRQLAECELNVGWALRMGKRPAEAISALNRALTLTSKLHRNDPTVAGDQRLLAKVLLELGASQLDSGQLGPAKISLQQSLELWEKLVRAYPANEAFRTVLAETAALLRKVREKQAHE